MAGNLTVANLFDTAMDALVTGLKTTGFATTEPWNKMIPKLKKVVGTTFEASEHTTLDDLRKAVDHAAKNGMKEGTFLAAGGGIAGSSTGATTAATADVQRCAALKMLRHTYYHAKRGNHKMWIVSLPESYSQWPDRYLAGALPQMLVKLNEGGEHFSTDERQHISEATQRGLGWVHKAQIVLDNVKDKSKGLPSRARPPDGVCWQPARPPNRCALARLGSGARGRGESRPPGERTSRAWGAGQAGRPQQQREGGQGAWY